MDSSNLIIDSSVLASGPSEQIKKTSGDTEAAKKQFAKDFESVFINKLLDEMKNTIGDWGEEKDGAGQQVEGIFWMHLARNLADNGGFGMWKDIYKSLNDSDHKNTVSKLLDKKI